MQAFREAAHGVFRQLPPAEMQDLQERTALVVRVPELRGRLLDEFTRTIDMIAALVAQRSGRSPDDISVLAFAGALIGVAMAVTLALADSEDVDFLAVLDEGLRCLEDGFSL